MRAARHADAAPRLSQFHPSFIPDPDVDPAVNAVGSDIAESEARLEDMLRIAENRFTAGPRNWAHWQGDHEGGFPPDPIGAPNDPSFHAVEAWYGATWNLVALNDAVRARGPGHPVPVDLMDRLAAAWVIARDADDDLVQAYVAEHHAHHHAYMEYAPGGGTPDHPFRRGLMQGIRRVLEDERERLTARALAARGLAGNEHTRALATYDEDSAERPRRRMETVAARARAEEVAREEVAAEDAALDAAARNAARANAATLMTTAVPSAEMERSWAPQRRAVRAENQRIEREEAAQLPLRERPGAERFFGDRAALDPPADTRSLGLHYRGPDSDLYFHGQLDWVPDNADMQAVKRARRSIRNNVRMTVREWQIQLIFGSVRRDVYDAMARAIAQGQLSPDTEVSWFDLTGTYDGDEET